MKLNKHRIAGAVLVGVSFVLALLLCILFYRTWRKDGKFVFFGDSARNDPFLSHRSLFAWLGFGVYCIFEMTVLRVAVVWVMVCRYPWPGGKLSFVATLAPAYCFLFSIPLVRCWRLRVRHMYYVVLGNADWSKLMDPSVEDSLSFWVKYKALLSSNRGVSAVVLLYTFFVVFLVVAVSHNSNFVRVRMIFMITAVITLLLSPLLLYKIPHNRDCLKLELQLIVALVMFTMATTATFVAVFGDSPVSSLINQSLYSCMDTAILLISFYWLPRRVERVEESGDALVHNQAYSRRKVLNVFRNRDVVMAFAKHCGEHLCVENLLAILEIKAFKRRVRKELVKIVEKEEMSQGPITASPEELLLEYRPSRDSLTSYTRSGDKGNGVLYVRASKDRRLSLGEVVSEEWTRWDQTVLVTLSQLGCRSAIVKGAGDARCKALALCSKYFEWDSEFSLNVSYENRSKVLALVGKDATAKLQSEALLFVFDEAIRDVFDNLSNVIDQFENPRGVGQKGNSAH